MYQNQTFSIGYCIGIRYFWNVSVSAHRYIFYRKCIGVSIHFMLPILFWYYFTPFWPKYSRKFKFLSKAIFSIFDNISYFKNLLTLLLNIMILSFEFLQKLSHKNAIKTEIRPKKRLKKYRYQILLKCIDTVLYRYIDTFDRK